MEWKRSNNTSARSKRERCPHYKGVIKTAAGNEESANEVMALLLERRGNDNITKEVVKAVAGNENSGKEMMMLLLE